MSTKETWMERRCFLGGLLVTAPWSWLSWLCLKKNEPALTKWFVFCEGNMEIYDSQEEALKYAQVVIDDYCDGEWMEEVENVMVGQVTHQAQAFNIVTKEMLDDEGCYNGRYYGGGYDHWCQYRPERV